MALTKTVNIDGKEVTFRASAAIPRIYRNRFHRDIYKDLHDLQKNIDQENPEASALDTFSLELLTIGTVNDMYTEMNNDENREVYSTLASQEDMDAF